MLEKVKNKIINKKYDGAWQLTDVCRCGFAVKDTKDIDKIIARLSKDVVVLDEGINFRESGYFDHVLSVRFKNGIIGEIQLLEPHLLAVKEGSEFVEQVFPKHLKEYVSDIKVPSKKKSGHDLYEQQKELLENGKVKEGKQEAFNDLDNQMEFLYARAEKSANTSWKASLERDLPESLISTGETRSQLELGSDKYQPSSRPSDGSIITAGRPSQLKKRDTSFQSNDTVFGESTDFKSAVSSGHPSWKSSLDITLPFLSISPSAKGIKPPPRLGENQPSAASSDRVMAAGRPSSEKKRIALLKLKSDSKSFMTSSCLLLLLDTWFRNISSIRYFSFKKLNIFA